VATTHSARCGDGSAYFQACLEAEEWNARLDANRQGGLGDAAKSPGTVPYFIAQFKTTPKYAGYSKATKVGTFEYGWRIVVQWSEALGHIPVKRITPAHCVHFYENLCEADEDGHRSYARAKNVIASLRRVLSYARLCGEIAVNPAVKLELESPALRLRRWEPHEIARFVAAARKAGRPSMALAVELNAVIGQRRGDTVALQWSQYQNGRFRIVQGKTDARVQVPVTPELAKKLAAAPRHKSGHIIYDEKQDKPYSVRHFSRVFRKIADDAGLYDLWYHDLRRTAVCALARAGATVAEIVAVTGHALDNATKVLKHYLFPDSALAEAAIAKLIDRQARERRAAQQVAPETTDDGVDLTNVIRFEKKEAA
jgi:integrase